jgi:Ca-activated chloride channel family protein
MKGPQALAATTSVAALMIGLFLTLPQGQPSLPEPAKLSALPEVAPEAPAPAPAAPPQTARNLAPTTSPKPEARADQGQLAEADKDKAAPPEVDAMAAKRGVVQVEGAARMGIAPPPPAASMSSDMAAAELAAPAIATPQRLANGQIVALQDAPMTAPEANTEAYANAAPNPVHITAEEPVSTFSVDVDTASYAVIRSSLNAGQLPPPNAVRIEEMVNYFPYAYPAPEGNAPFANTVSVMPTPWNPNTRLVHIALQGRPITERPALNLVFLIDTSGSMQDANKLPLLKQSLSLMLGRLQPQDQVAIVAYAGAAGEVLPPTPARDRDRILNALNTLDAGGSTAGAEGLQLAYLVAGQMKTDGRVTRVLLATDGDFNVGVDTPEGLKSLVAQERAGGTYLSVLGFGRGNLDDATMQALAQNGNGTASYIDTLSEAQKVLGDQLTGALYPIADDVKVQVEWNPAQVAEYRLIGYETRTLAREDFNNDRVDAGEIGAGLQVTALYEVTAPNSPALLNNPLRYGEAPASNTGSELGFLRLRYKKPGETMSNLIETPITGTEPATTEASFAAAIAGFGQLLQNAAYLKDWGYEQAIALATTAKGPDDYGYRAEAITLMRLAHSLSQTAANSPGIPAALSQIAQCWNVDTLSSNAPQSQITLRVLIDGNAIPIVGTITVVGPTSNGQNQIFGAARRAMIRCGHEGLPLAPGAYLITFDAQLGPVSIVPMNF